MKNQIKIIIVSLGILLGTVQVAWSDETTHECNETNFKEYVFSKEKIDDLIKRTQKGCYLREADLAGAYLNGAYLTWANLYKADLTGAYLNGAYLKWAYLTGANLYEADLTEANLTGAYLTGANLYEADLTEADLIVANLTGANLTEADLTGAYLKGANLTGANLTGAKFVKDGPYKTIFPKDFGDPVDRGMVEIQP